MRQAWIETAEGGLTALDITGQDLSATRCVVLAGLETPARIPGAWPRLGGLLAGLSGREAFAPELVPPNDGGLAAGQLAVALALLR